MTAPAIILLNQHGLETAREIKTALKGAVIWGLEGRTTGTDETFTETTAHLRELYQIGQPILGLCAAGILIRALSPLLENKRGEPPVLAIADDGAVIVPLLGGLTGANELARTLSTALGGTAAITASGARRLGLQLEAPPEGYMLANPAEAKRITSDILSGKSVRLEGDCPWLAQAALPFSETGEITLRVSAHQSALPEDGLLYHPKTLLIEIRDEAASIADITDFIERHGLAMPSLAAFIVSQSGPVGTAKQLARSLGLPLRLIGDNETLTAASLQPSSDDESASKLALYELSSPSDLTAIGRPLGKLAVIGLGPGQESWRTPEVTAALKAADCFVGYKTYLDMVPASYPQPRHASDNRVEIDRAIEALDLAKSGQHVLVISSGDPGIYAMAGAVMEALDQAPGRWPHIDFEILPGLSAMQGAAAKIGAPLGHDFAVISLSDIRKPFEIIEQRLTAAATSDMVIAIYNPASKTRREQVERMKALLLTHKSPETHVLLARNIGRDGEAIELTTLGALDTDRIDMRTMLIIGSSKTKRIAGPDGQPLLYTPRSYE